MKKMMFSVLLSMLMSVSCAGEKEMKITDFEKYQSLTREPVQIIVQYEDDLTGTFVIDDLILIGEMVSILFDETVYVRGGEGSHAGNNGQMIFVDREGTRSAISLYAINDRGKDFFPKSNALLMRLREIGVELGALTER